MKSFFSLFAPMIVALEMAFLAFERCVVAVATGFERHAIAVVCAVERLLADAFPIAAPHLPRETPLDPPRVIGLEQTRAFQARREARSAGVKPDWLEHGIGLAA